MRRLIPSPLLEAYRSRQRRLRQERNSGKSVEEVFTEIYETNAWGGAPGEYCSGSGTTDERVVSPYVSKIFAEASFEKFSGSTFVDIGCGDFRVGRQLLPLCSNYIGVDVVEGLIRRNQVAFGNGQTKFLHLNVIESDPPEGDVCFVRQVFQHLSNAEILACLGRLARYGLVYVTEHYPPDNDDIRPNVDKIHGGDIRLYDNSGVYLTEPPFSVPRSAIQQILEVSADGSAEGGVIRTFRYRPAG